MTILNQPITLIEADVVIVLTNKAFARLEVHSLWECEMSQRELRIHSLRLAQQFNEACGGGYVEISIRDFRSQPTQEATPAAGVISEEALNDKVAAAVERIVGKPLSPTTLQILRDVLANLS